MMRLTCDMEWNAKKQLQVADDKWGKIMQQETKLLRNAAPGYGKAR